MSNSSGATSSNLETPDQSPKECFDEQPVDTSDVEYEDLGKLIKDKQETFNITDPEFEPETCENERSRRSRPINLPKHLKDYYLYNIQEVNESQDRDPVTVKDALQSPEAGMWKKAMDEVIKNLTEAPTWKLTTKTLGVKIIPFRWLFHKKKDETGTRTKFKARLVAKGYLQVSGVDFQDTFSPVIKLKSILLV